LCVLATFYIKLFENNTCGISLCYTYPSLRVIISCVRNLVVVGCLSPTTIYFLQDQIVINHCDVGI